MIAVDLKEPSECPSGAASGSGKGNRHTKAGRVGFELRDLARVEVQGIAYMWKVGV